MLFRSVLVAIAGRLLLFFEDDLVSASLGFLATLWRVLTLGYEVDGRPGRRRSLQMPCPRHRHSSPQATGVTLHTGPTLRRITSGGKALVGGHLFLYNSGPTEPVIRA